MKTRYLILVLLLAYVSLLTGCTLSVGFVVINKSDQSIEVRCKVDSGSLDPSTVIGPLAITKDSKLGASDEGWRLLALGEYHVNLEDHTVTVRLMPDDALQVGVVPLEFMRDDEPSSFNIQEISITGSDGAIMLQGKQVTRAFLPETKRLHTLTYK